jgi:hypothetical protein
MIRSLQVVFKLPGTKKGFSDKVGKQRITLSFKILTIASTRSKEEE